MFRKLSDVDACFIESNISMDKIKVAVWSCACSKASESDYFKFNFIKAY